MKKLLLIALPVLFSFGVLAQTSSDSIFTEADQLPVFSGCWQEGLDAEARQLCSNRELVLFISRQLEYPAAARDSGITGTVYVSFVVDDRGRVTQAEILKDIGAGCGEAALELVGSMPPWQPAIYQGKKVKFRLNLPIQFNLKAPDSDISQAYTISWGQLSGAEHSKTDFISHIGKSLLVRNIQGESLSVEELVFSFEKGRKLKEAGSRGEINSEIQNLLKKLKTGGVLTIMATVQEKGRFINVSRSFRVGKS